VEKMGVAGKGKRWPAMTKGGSCKVKRKLTKVKNKENKKNKK
jgi:hypothetical protein